MILNTQLKKTVKFFEDCGVRLLDWPLQSPELSPIENLWGIMEQRVEKRLQKDKFDEIETIWQGVNTKLFKKIVKSITRRLKV